MSGEPPRGPWSDAVGYLGIAPSAMVPMSDRLNDGPRLALWCALHPDDAAGEIERLRSERKILDKRIHNQRVALRENWEIIEMRAQYRRAWYPSPLLKRMLLRSTRMPQTWWMKLLGVRPAQRT